MGSQRQTDRSLRENRDQQRQTDKQLKELGKQTGGLGRKFGVFTEGMALSPIKKILRQKFNITEAIFPSAELSRDGRHEEYDVLAYQNGDQDTGIIVEIKSNLRPEDLTQMKRKLDEVFHFLPAHTDKTFYGILACVSGSTDLKRKVIANGWYLAHIGEDLFELEVPEGFKPRAYRAK